MCPRSRPPRVLRSNVCFDSMVGTEALLVLDSDGSPDHNECMDFMAKHMWESKLFNPTGEVSPFAYGSSPPPSDGVNPFCAPGVRRVLLDVMYTKDTIAQEGRIQGFTPTASIMGNGSVKCIVVLYSFMRPIHPPRLVLATHKCNGKGSGSGGHFPVGWALHHNHPLSHLIAGLAEHVLCVPGWGRRMGVPTLSHDTISSLITHPSQAFPEAMLKHNSTRTFDPYTILDVLTMKSVAIKVPNCIAKPRTTLMDPPRCSPRRDHVSSDDETPSPKRRITRATSSNPTSPTMVTRKMQALYVSK